MKRQWLFVLMALPAFAQQPSVTLADLERLALAASPSLQQSAADVRAAAGRARQAGMYPNPVLGASGDHVAGGPVLNGGDLGGFVEQRVITGGKLGLARQSADQSRLAAVQLQEAQRLRVLTTIRGLFYQALGEQRLLAVRKEMAELAARTAQTARELANLGQSDRPDVLAAEVEAQRAELGVTLAQNALDRTGREISAMTGQQSTPAAALEGDLEAIPKIEAGTELAKIYAASPQLRAAEALRSAADLQLHRAHAENIPDILLRGGVRYNRELTGNVPLGTEGFFDVGVQIPLFNHNQGAIATAAADADRARLQGDREKQLLARRFAAVYQEYRDAMDASARYRDSIIPAARQAHDMYASNFANMAAPHMQVLMTQRSLFQVEEEYVMTVMAAWRSVVAIEGLLAGED